MPENHADAAIAVLAAVGGIRSRLTTGRHKIRHDGSRRRVGRRDTCAMMGTACTTASSCPCRGDERWEVERFERGIDDADAAVRIVSVTPVSCARGVLHVGVLGIGFLLARCVRVAVLGDAHRAIKALRLLSPARGVPTLRPGVAGTRRDDGRASRARPALLGGMRRLIVAQTRVQVVLGLNLPALFTHGRALREGSGGSELVKRRPPGRRRAVIVAARAGLAGRRGRPHRAQLMAVAARALGNLGEVGKPAALRIAVARPTRRAEARTERSSARSRDGRFVPVARDEAAHKLRPPVRRRRLPPRVGERLDDERGHGVLAGRRDGCGERLGEVGVQRRARRRARRDGVRGWRVAVVGAEPAAHKGLGQPSHSHLPPATRPERTTRQSRPPRRPCSR